MFHTLVKRRAAARAVGGRWPARLTHRVAEVIAGLAMAAALGGCPVGAELENPERFPQLDAGPPGVGGATAGAAGTGQGGTAGSAVAGAAGSAGAAGNGSGTWTWNCTEIPLEGKNGALELNCVRACHNALAKNGGLDMTDVATARASMLDKPASFSGFGCQEPGTPYRECTREQAIARGCPDGVKLVDSMDVEASWVLTKLHGTAHGRCGAGMPAAPGNHSSRGWDADGRRKQCFLDFFRSLAVPQ